MVVLRRRVWLIQNIVPLDLGYFQWWKIDCKPSLLDVLTNFKLFLCKISSNRSPEFLHVLFIKLFRMCQLPSCVPKFILFVVDLQQTLCDRVFAIDCFFDEFKIFNLRGIWRLIKFCITTWASFCGSWVLWKYIITQ